MSANASITVDGSAGGQSLRTALTLSLVTQRPFRVESFCAGRIAPGLRPRHLALLRAAEALGGRVEGGQAGALAFQFQPGPVSAGSHVLELGASAPSCLVFQCLFYPLALSGGGVATNIGGLPNQQVVPTVLLYSQGFALSHFGYANTIAWALFLTVAALIILQRRLESRWVHYER